MARVVSVAEDLMLASRVDATLTAAGHHVILARSLQEATLDGAELVVADLDVENPEALVGLGVPVLGYYSHVDTETRQRAEAAGVDLVVPRSRMSRELPALVEKLLAEDSAA
jgi:DNA-binding NarL/FixJ family response regulator